jgi:hypothetical protein
MRLLVTIACASIAALAVPSVGHGQRIQFPNGNGLRPIQVSNSGVSAANQFSDNSGMVPLSPGGPVGPPNSPYPSASGFDPYTTRQVTTPNFPQSTPGSPLYGGPGLGGTAAGTPYGGQQIPNLPPGNGAVGPYGLAPNYGLPQTGYPGYNGAAPAFPGVGQSGVLGTYPNPNASIYGPSAVPNNSPSALFPGAYPQSGYGYGQSGGLSSWFGNLFGNGNNWNGSGVGYSQPGILNPPGNLVLPPGAGWGNWNPQGSIFNGSPTYPQVLRLFQGPRIRHAWIYGSNDNDALQINDSDIALAFAIPNFLYSTQPVFLMPSFSVHQWEGPRDVAADLPAIAYSAFLDAGWQSDPARILGAELALRVGMFSDFETATSDSLRIMGRGLGRIRLTPALTLKAGAVYLDRNKIKVLPAGGLLWQPNPETRFDLFFPEPKLAHYLATIGTMDTWWYVGGYYGGGSWTVTRKSGAKESIDINDLRLVLGLEWGRNDQLRDGRRFGFLEAGYVFQRELLFKERPVDNLDLQDSVMVRAGFGY